MDPLGGVCPALGARGVLRSDQAGRVRRPWDYGLGVNGYARNKRLRGAGWFLRGGARGDLEVMVLVIPRLAYHSALLETNLSGYLDVGFVY